MAQAIRAKKISSEEVIKAYQARIEAVNPILNAVVQLNPEAEVQARCADQALVHRENIGSLHGVPFTVKEAFEVAGLASTGLYFTNFSKTGPATTELILRAQS